MCSPKIPTTRAERRGRLPLEPEGPGGGLPSCRAEAPVIAQGKGSGVGLGAGVPSGSGSGAGSGS